MEHQMFTLSLSLSLSLFLTHTHYQVLAWKLSSFDKYVIIASDGLFEFLTSQAVIDIISKVNKLGDSLCSVL